jgi:hypothetical protein
VLLHLMNCRCSAMGAASTTIISIQPC